MPSEFVSREGQAAALDTWYTLSGDGVGGTKSSYVVSAGKSKIKKVIMGLGTGASASKQVLLLRLSGSGVQGGFQVIAGPWASNVGTAVTSKTMPAFCLPVDIGVNPGGEITMEVKLTGTGDSGTPEVAVGLEVI